MNREDNLQRATAETSSWDVVVVGGGATGLGAALDAVSRGYRTLLLEQADFAKGTSSRSTKLIHGGVRYLRSGQVRMVRESLVERGRLVRNAPHLVHSRRFIVPAFRWYERWFYFAGMKLYDWLGGSSGFAPARLLSARSTSELLPTLRRDGLRGGVQYSDGQFDDARLALALAQAIVNGGGALLNYASVTAMSARQADGTREVTWVDGESKQEHTVRTRCLVNATGVFAAQLMHLDPSFDRDSSPTVVPSQGTHIVLDGKFLGGQQAIMIPHTDDGRVLFAIPWQGKTLLGTTDHEVPEVELEPRPLAHEVDYLVEHAARYLTPSPTRADVLSQFSGLRPLVGKGNAKSTSGLSREHEIHVSNSGLITIIGGKWTTYRKMGQDVIDLAVQVGQLRAQRSATAELSLDQPLADSVELPGPDGDRSEGGSRPQRAPDLECDFSLYGQQAAAIKASIATNAGWGEPLHERLPYCLAQVHWAVRYEMARTVDDVLARRTRALLLDAQAAFESASKVAEILGDYLGHDTAWRSAQVQAFKSLASQYIAVP